MLHPLIPESVLAEIQKLQKFAVLERRGQLEASFHSCGGGTRVMVARRVGKEGWQRSGERNR
eukprot:751527-Hanusia_phi.AAC.2